MGSSRCGTSRTSSCGRRCRIFRPSELNSTAAVAVKVAGRFLAADSVAEKSAAAAAAAAAAAQVQRFDSGTAAAVSADYRPAGPCLRTAESALVAVAAAAAAAVADVAASLETRRELGQQA